MRKITGLALAYVTLLCCIAAAQGGVIEELQKSGLALGETNLFRIKESWNVWEQAGPAIWPGVKVEDIPLPFPEYMAKLAHESFHVYQNLERKLLPARTDRTAFLSARKESRKINAISFLPPRRWR
jgi:hypothetical protein